MKLNLFAPKYAVLLTLHTYLFGSEISNAFL